MNKTLIVLGGPTASGKTGCSIRLAQYYNTEVISADSRQIYKETSIGTAVPEPDELSVVKHHFIQTVSVKDYYNASIYEQDVLILLNDLFKKSEVVLLVGGSGLYIDAVCSGIDDLPVVDREVRMEYAEKLKTEGLSSLQRELKERDPVTYEKVDLKNPMRVLKALEISAQTGKPYSSFLTKKDKKREFNIIRIALDLDRNELYDTINMRVDQMMKKGLLEEVRKLMPVRDCIALKTVGYKELFQHLDGAISLEEAVVQIKNNSRKYARKQLTWFRKKDLYKWFHPSDFEGIKRYIDTCLLKTMK